MLIPCASIDSILESLNQGDSLRGRLISPWQTQEVSVPNTWLKIFGGKYSTDLHYLKGDNVIEILVENDLNVLTRKDKIRRGVSYVRLEDYPDLDLFQQSYRFSLGLAYERVKNIKKDLLLGAGEMALGGYLTYSYGDPILALFAITGLVEIGSGTINYFQNKYAGFGHSILGPYAPVISEKNPSESGPIVKEYGPFLTGKEALQKVFRIEGISRRSSY